MLLLGLLPSTYKLLSAIFHFLRLICWPDIPFCLQKLDGKKNQPQPPLCKPAKISSYIIFKIISQEMNGYVPLESTDVPRPENHSQSINPF